MMDKDTTTLKRTLAHNRAFIDSINRSGIAWCYNTEIVLAACEAIEAELQRRGCL
ncbi:hypothetical protein KDF02_004120 [Shigella flexneri]|jgi:hypothetical protein|uniref:Uncharacterized protein n=1 Tax=Escherichia marmotae TaxID=1499973 RepID=A0A7W3APS0_9ESCH|nr:MULTISPECIES: hypothetical protein [Escherichia]EHG3156240.1 hypothetical protein [Salmonella enterica]EIZ6473570.1 hypothetical protein [Salmonella enterica subsp. enterica serovar Typhimurium]EJF9503264.1 hypothetical protein [Shigella flexneri]EET0060073.1 hypothetical protein [Escherichia coli]EEV9505653.1 hypothetical protein [Escherichia coli]